MSSQEIVLTDSEESQGTPSRQTAMNRIDDSPVRKGEPVVRKRKLETEESANPRSSKKTVVKKTLAYILRIFFDLFNTKAIAVAAVKVMDERLTTSSENAETCLLPLWGCLKRLIFLNTVEDIPDSQPFTREEFLQIPLLPLPDSDERLEAFDSNVALYTTSCTTRMENRLRELFRNCKPAAERMVRDLSASQNIEIREIATCTSSMIVPGTGHPASATASNTNNSTEDLDILLSSIRSTTPVCLNISTADKEGYTTWKSTAETARTVYQFSQYKWEAIKDQPRRDWWRHATHRILIASLTENCPLEQSGKEFV